MIDNHIFKEFRSLDFSKSAMGLEWIYDNIEEQKANKNK